MNLMMELLMISTMFFNAVLKIEQKYIFRTLLSSFLVSVLAEGRYVLFFILNGVLCLVLDPLETVKKLRFDNYEN